MSRQEQSRFYDQGFSRRDFLKFGAKAVGGSAAGFLLYNEGKKIIEGIETDNGIFYPSYEVHTIGIAESEIRNDLNILFVEDWVGLNQEFISVKVYGIGENGVRNLQKIASQGTEVMFGDVYIGSYLKKNSTAVDTEAFLGTAALLFSRSKEFNKMTRKALLGIGIWGLSGFLTLPFYMGVSQIQDARVKQILSRIAGIGTLVHPEYVKIHFRSAVMADKMLEAAKQFRAKNGVKAKIGFNVGAGHADIEDFLQLGQGFCQDFILSHPSGFLKEAVQLSGGPHQFSTAMVIKYDPGNIDRFSNKSYVADIELSKRLARKIA